MLLEFHFMEDKLFQQAVQYIDTGNLDSLQDLISQNADLVRERFSSPEDGYFKRPYLLWFIADNPIRIPRLPSNIIGIAKYLVASVLNLSPSNAQIQLDYTLGLVCTGRIPRESGVQIELMNLLINTGAIPNGGIGALAHGNKAAAAYLLERGLPLNLGLAVGLERRQEIKTLFDLADQDEKLTALAIAAFYGIESIIDELLAWGVDPNGYPSGKSGFHAHATPLHQAVSSGSLSSVKSLVKGGADLNARDKVYFGRPLDWAEYMPTEEGCTDADHIRYESIANFLRSV